MHHTDYKRALTQRFSLERITSALQNSHNRRLLHGIMLTLAGGSLWGANATLSKIIMDTYAISPLWLACIREIFAALLFLLCAYKQTPDKVRAVFEHPSSLISIALVAYDAILLSQVSYLQAINWTNSATATILQNICVIFVMVYVCVVNRRAPKRREIAGLIFGYCWHVLYLYGRRPLQVFAATRRSYVGFELRTCGCDFSYSPACAY